MFERRLYFHIDWLLLGAVVLLSLIGVAMIYSTTYVTANGVGHAAPQVWTQVYALGLGVVALLLCLAVDYRMLAEHSLFIYGSLIVLLVFVLLKGQTQMGGQRWIRSARSTCSPPSSAASPWRCCWRCTSARTAAARGTRAISSSPASSRSCRSC